MTDDKDEAAYQFAMRLHREGKLPRNRGKGWAKDYKDQMQTLKEQFDKEQRDAGKTNL